MSGNAKRIEPCPKCGVAGGHLMSCDHHEDSYQEGIEMERARVRRIIEDSDLHAGAKRYLLAALDELPCEGCPDPGMPCLGCPALDEGANDE